MVDIRSLISQIPMEPGYVPAPPEPDLSVIQRLMGLPQTLRAVGQNMAVGAASLPVGVYKGFGNPAAGEAAMSQFQQEYGYTPTNPAAQRQLQGLGEFLQQLETEYKIPPMISPSQLPSRAATAGSAMQLGRIGTRMTGQAQDLARDLVREIQTTPPTGAVTMAPSSIPKSDIGFYSQLEAAVQPLQNKGTGQQYLAQIQKSAGVKPEEIQWTGLDEFLKGKKSVTKQEIQDYLNANRVDVQEVRLLGSAPLTEQAFNERFARRGFSMVQTDDGPRFRQTDMTGSRQLTYGELPEDIQATIERQSVPQTKHHLGAYQGIKTEIPGGENYRELLLTLPQKGGVDVKAAEQTRDTLARQTADLMEEWKRLSEEMPGDPRVVELYGRLSETRRARDQAVVDARELRKAAESQTYRSSHFDQPNILAHLRVNDRTVDGKKTLFVEEIQSDWHQAGRKKGYKSEIDPNENASLVKQYDSLTAKRRQIEEIVATGDDASPVTQNAIQNLNQINAELERVSDRLSEIRTAAREGVPDAPFKTSWHELSLKRAIQEAAEKGYDQIAFTTGKTQAERYDLSKQVDNVSYFPSTKTIVAYKGGNSVVEKRVADPKELEEIIGKEAAKKLLNQPTEKIVNARGNEVQSLSGVDLQVGGEGMKGFYDNILPKSLDKLGKKFGAKVGKTEMDGVEVWQMDITPQMRESVTTKGQPLFAIPAIGAGLLGAGMMQEEEQF
jgi:hypothetical protein